MDALTDRPAPVVESANPNPITKFEIGSLKLFALSDRVLVLEDQFKSGYECPTCDGKRRLKCADCNGEGENNGKKCSTCEGEKSVICADCGGKGGIIIAPETTERRPTTGTIVSVGPDCKRVKLGDSVMYSSFAGYVVDLSRAHNQIVLRILHESEILCGLEGQLTLTNFKGKSEIALHLA